MPAGLRPSPSFFCGSDEAGGLVKPRPQPSPLRPNTTRKDGPICCQSRSLRSNRRSEPSVAVQSLVVTTTIWLDWERVSSRGGAGWAFSQKGSRPIVTNVQILHGIKNAQDVDKSLLNKAR